MAEPRELLYRLRPTFAFVLPLIIIVALALFLRVREQSRPVAFTVDFPGVVEVRADEPMTPVEITLNLENRRANNIDLIADNDCRMMRWFIIHSAGSLVQAQYQDACGQSAVAEVLRGRGTLVRTTTIPLDTDRYTPGQRYELVVEFWGYRTSTRFRVRAAE
jgi:hypothetical protein